MSDRSEDIRQAKRLRREYQKLRRQKQRRQRAERLLPALIFTAAAVGAGFLLYAAAKPHRAPADPDALQVWFLDVGQGDSVLLQSQGHAVLIDAGEPAEGSRVLHMLRELGVRHLDFAVNSHPHSDHLGGMETVLRETAADALYLPAFPASLTPTAVHFTKLLDFCEETALPLRQPACGETVMFGGASLRFLCVDNAGFDDLNNCSLGCEVTYGTQSVLLAGDLEQAGEDAFLAAGLVPHADVIKVSHHGSSGSSSAPFLDAVSPQIAVISCGAGNDYGHPAPSALGRLRDAGCEVYRTDLDGTVRVIMDGSSGITVQTHQ